MMSSEPLAIFVYGTLQRGEERAKEWPRPPLRVEPATTRGRLYDLGAYPALSDGDDLVRGELWHISAEDLALTLQTLDEIEGVGSGDNDLYVRRVIECWTDDGKSQRGYAYLFARPDALRDVPPIAPDDSGFCQWRRHSASS
jgi:gamma-glutamylcyclotransferase (GGCT)/AIG2-like uncharacterized protein YtfP